MSTTTNKTAHAATCTRVFNRLDASCPRCQELAAGAPARQWLGSREHRADQQRIAEIRAHDCARAGCGPICTFGDH